MDLIDRGRLKAAYLKEHVGKPGRAYELICEAETVETRAVKKAKWIVRGFRYVCDRCGHDESVSSKFCPNCGAKMDCEVWMKPEEVKSELIDIYEHAVEYHDGRSDEAVDMAVEALNKQIPKKPLIDDGKDPVCPCCFGVHSKRRFIVASSLTVRS